jgi:hypothetical protein
VLKTSNFSQALQGPPSMQPQHKFEVELLGEKRGEIEERESDALLRERACRVVGEGRGTRG